MAGKHSVRKRRPNTSCARQKMWQSMRILKRFCLPDIMRTVPGATEINVRHFLMRLESTGYIGRIGTYVSGRAGQYQGYALLKDIGPVMPVLGLGTGWDKPAKPCTDLIRERENEGNHER